MSSRRTRKRTRAIHRGDSAWLSSPTGRPSVARRRDRGHRTTVDEDERQASTVERRARVVWTRDGRRIGMRIRRGPVLVRITRDWTATRQPRTNVAAASKALEEREETVVMFAVHEGRLVSVYRRCSCFSSSSRWTRRRSFDWARSTRTIDLWARSSARHRRSPGDILVRPFG